MTHSPITIALDVMGGDLGPNAVIPGAALALAARPSLRFLLVGDESVIQPALQNHPDLARVSDIIHTTQVISGEDKIAQALRNGRHSSMRMAIDCVADNRAAAIVSSGNTGALMATAKMVLKCIPGIHRPAIASQMPTQKGSRVIMLDLGANLACDAEMLVQFAILGTVFAREIFGLDRPSVGILNVGSEEMKGHEEVRAAASIMSQIKFPGRFHGFIEGNDIALGTVDVVVTDGFTGNVALKTAEGIGKMAQSYMKDAFKSSPLAMFGALFAARALKKMKDRIDPRLYNGGLMLGLNGICVKSHGSTDAVGFSSAIIVAADMASHGYNKRVGAAIANVMTQESFVAAQMAATAE
ncbi:MAG: phosphate acyltransferase PlsX [Pseudomonadota bacterium]